MTDKPTDHDPEIVTSSIVEPVRAQDAALNDEEDRWLGTVLASLPERSGGAKEALLKALVDGRTGDQTKPHLSGTTTPVLSAPVGCASYSAVFASVWLPWRV